MSDSEKTEPEQVDVRGIDVIPYEYAIWCTVGGGEPFANVVERRSWSDDGQRIWLMLGTHNFYDCKPDEMVRVVATGKEYRKCSKSLFGCDCPKCFAARKPNPLPEEAGLVAAVNALPGDARKRVMNQVKS